MTRQEITGIRDLSFSTWIRQKLPCSSTGFVVSDLDFILTNYKTKKLMLIEVKTRNKEIARWQSILLKNISKWLTQGIDDDYEYYGCHVIKFENTSFEDGKCYFDDQEITEPELIERLSMFDLP